MDFSCFVLFVGLFDRQLKLFLWHACLPAFACGLATDAKWTKIPMNHFRFPLLPLDEDRNAKAQNNNNIRKLNNEQ